MYPQDPVNPDPVNPYASDPGQAQPYQQPVDPAPTYPTQPPQQYTDPASIAQPAANPFAPQTAAAQPEYTNPYQAPAPPQPAPQAQQYQQPAYHQPTMPPAPAAPYPAQPTAAMPPQHPQLPSIASIDQVPHVSNPFITVASGLVSILKTNPVSALLVTFAGFLAYFVLILLLTLVSGVLPGVIVAILAIGIYIVLVPLLVGSNLVVAASSASGSEVSTQTALKRALSKTFPLVGLLLLSGLVTVGGLILLIIPGLIIIARISLAPVIMFEENLGPIDALKRSSKLTKGHFFEMWGALIAGLLFAPYGLLAPAAGVAPVLGRYQQYKSLEQAGNIQKQPVHWLNYLCVAIPIIAVVLVIIFTTLMGNALKNRSDKLERSFEYDSTPSLRYDSPSYEAPSYQYDF